MFKSSIKASKMSKGIVNNEQSQQTIAAGGLFLDGIMLQSNVKYKHKPIKLSKYIIYLYTYTEQIHFILCKIISPISISNIIGIGR